MNIKNPMHPGEFLLEVFMKPHGITSEQLARALGVSRSTVSRIINKNMDLTAGVAARLSVVVGRTPESWMIMQNNYSLNKFMSKNQSELSSLKRIEFDFDGERIE